MAYENTVDVPFSGNLPFRGSATINGEPVNRSNAGYKTFGGACVYSGDSNNTGLTATFGVVVSTIVSGDTNLLAIGKPAGYTPRGIIMANNSVLQNEPAKAGYMLQDLPITVGYEGTFTYQAWTKTQTGSIDPVPGCLIIYRAITGGTAGCAIGALEFLPAGTVVPTSFAILPGYVVSYDTANGDCKIELNFDNNVDHEKADLFALSGIPFRRTVTITSAAAATAIPILTDAEVGVGKKVYINQAIGNVAGATVWATTATVAIQDTADVAGITYAVAGMTANATLFPNTANVTLATVVSRGLGFTAGKGISVKGNANGTGSDYVVTVTGFIA